MSQLSVQVELLPLVLGVSSGLVAAEVGEGAGDGVVVTVLLVSVLLRV